MNQNSTNKIKKNIKKLTKKAQMFCLILINKGKCTILFLFG